MNRRLVPTLLYTGTFVATLVVLSGCAGGNPARTWFSQRSTAQAPTRPAAHPIIAQVAYGTKARFVICAREACPHPTPKTLASEAPPTESLAQSLLAGPPSQGPCESKIGTDANAAIRQQALRGRTAAMGQPCQPTTTTSASVNATGADLIQFSGNNATLNGAAKAAIEQLLPQATAARSIIVTGYTDSVGNAAANRRLALHRAAAVRDYLEFIAPGSADKTQVRAKVDCCHIANNRRDQGRRANRHAHVGFTFAVAAGSPQSDRIGAVGAVSCRPLNQRK